MKIFEDKVFDTIFPILVVIHGLIIVAAIAAAMFCVPAFTPIACAGFCNGALAIIYWVQFRKHDLEREEE